MILINKTTWVLTVKLHPLIRIMNLLFLVTSDDTLIPVTIFTMIMGNLFPTEIELQNYSTVQCPISLKAGSYNDEENHCGEVVFTDNNEMSDNCY